MFIPEGYSNKIPLSYYRPNPFSCQSEQKEGNRFPHFFHQTVYNAYKNTSVYSSTVILNTKTSHLIVKLETLTITFGSRRLTWKHNRQIFYASVRYYTTSCAITFFFFYLNCTGFIVPTVNLLVTNSYRDDSTELRWRVTTVCGDEKRQQIWDGIG